jgi:hypothetical protein
LTDTYSLGLASTYLERFTENFSESMWNLVYEEAKRFLLSHEIASWVNRRQLM